MGRLAFGLTLALVSGAAAAQDLTGPARVIDSDGLEIGGARIMLFGIESVERPQVCFIRGRPWACYDAAVRQLETITGVADVSCTQIGAHDHYGRVLARCSVAGESVNEALVRAGFALAKRDETEEYVPAEDAARAERIGLWQGDFQYPRAFRLSRGIFIDRP